MSTESSHRADAEDYLQRARGPRRLYTGSVRAPQKSGDGAPRPRSSDGPSIGRSAHSTAGGAAGQLSAKK